MDFYENFNSFFEKHLNKIFYLSLILTILFSFLLFDVRVSLSGDDSAYIVRAFDFIKDFKYPGFQGPLYPIILSPFVLLFGINLILLKSLSVVFMVGFMWFFFKTFVKRVPAFVLSATLILLSINNYLLYYSSQTYSEAFFMFIQVLFFYNFFKYFIDNTEILNVKQNIKRHLVLASFLMLLFLTKNIGIVAFVIVIIYFLIEHRWKDIAYAVSAFLVLFILFHTLKIILWNDNVLQFSSQGNSLMLKDYYKPLLGKEDLPGFIHRLFQNSNIYLSSVFCTFLGFWSDIRIENQFTIITVIFYFILSAGIYSVYKKNKFLLFTGIYILFFLIATFIILQTIWHQGRLIIPVFPYIIIFFLSIFYYFLQKLKIRLFLIIVIIIPLIILTTSIINTEKKVEISLDTYDIYDGLSPGWINYIKVSKWAAENIPTDQIIACRKPTISFIYGKGRQFYGIYYVPSYPLDSILKIWKNNNQKFIAVKYGDLKQKSFNFFVKLNMASYFNALVNDGKRQILIFNVPTENKDTFFLKLNSYTNKFIQNPDSLKKIVSAKAEVFFPDSLLNNLVNNNVRYIISENFQFNPEQKEHIINTMYRYVTYVMLKYPLLFTDVIKFGNVETIKLQKINYEIYNIQIGKSVKKIK